MTDATAMKIDTVTDATAMKIDTVTDATAMTTDTVTDATVTTIDEIAVMIGVTAITITPVGIPLLHMLTVTLTPTIETIMIATMDETEVEIMTIN